MPDPILFEGEDFQFSVMNGTDGRGMAQTVPASGGYNAERRWDRFWRKVLATIDIVNSAYNLLSLVGTSTTSLAIGTGTKTLTTQTGLGYKEGMIIVYAAVGDALATRMEGVVTAYNSGTGSLSIDSTITSGSGTYNSWHIFPKQGAMDGPGSASDYATAAANGTTGKLVRYISDWLFDSSGNYSASDKILSRAIFKDCAEKTQSVDADATTNIDITAGNVVILTHDANITTLNLNNPSPTGNACFLLIHRVKDNNGTARTITWPASVKWGNNGANVPVLTQSANAEDVILLWTVNAGSTWRGKVIDTNYA